MQKGKLIVLEGTDGSGKETQTRLLCESLEKKGCKLQRLSFPCYGTPAAVPLEMYLRGEFGKHPGDVGPYAASMFYETDRFASYKTGWGKFYEDGGLVISDRYTTSNAIHQGCKLPDGKRQDYLEWLYDFEYQKIGLPTPDLVIYLDVPTEISVKIAAERAGKAGVQHDIHETDVGYQTGCRIAALDTATRSGWRIVRCAERGKLRSIEDIHQEVLKIAEGMWWVDPSRIA